MNLKSRDFTKTTHLSVSIVARALPFLLGFVLLCLSAPALFADGHTFDLAGPRIDMTVTRTGRTLPISRVTDLLPGDQVWFRAEFPGDQSVRYLLIVTFLQGPTNPPPENWFTRVETWTKQTRQQGTFVTVPDGAQQVLVFLAPETGGDFATLRSTVRGHPGVFVRAAQDLEQASLDRTRLEKYLDEITKTSNTDPSALKKNSTLLAQTLRIKVNEDCFSRPVEQQASCLLQGGDQMVLDDSHDQSLVASLTSGASSDLISNVSSSPLARGGYFSPYVGAVVDVVRLMSTLHTATYQYIPALSLPDKDVLNLKLNAAPSFRNPKSVIVMGLPSIGSSPVPVLHPVNPKTVLCLQQSPFVLPVEGAPLMFSTAMGHSFVVRIESKSGHPVDLPATPDAVRGGFLVDTKSLHTATMDAKLTATLRGDWGYTSFEGPHFELLNAHSEHWTIPHADSSTLLAGHPATLHLQGDCAVCVEKVSLLDAKGQDLKPTWKSAAADQLEIALPLKDAPAGKYELAVAQYGQSKPDVVPLQAYSDAAHLEHFTMFAGDSRGTLTGTHLEEVASLELNTVHFLPAKSPDAHEAKDTSKENAKDSSLDLIAENSSAISTLLPNSAVPAHVTLKDGRKLDVPATIEPPRPKLTLLSKSLQPAATPSPVHFPKPDALPQDSRLSFFLKTDAPGGFPRTEKVEIAAVDGSFSSTLSLTDGSLIQQDTNSVLALLDPMKAFGPAAFGALEFRGIDADGGKGDWQPLATIVRVPTLKEIRCPDDTDKPCTLYGSNLFLLASVAANAQFKMAIAVPEAYVNDSIDVPRPYGTRLYIKLRDDPSTVATVNLPVLPDTR
ncbi:MAG TPA: hypothetical protein VMU53_18255 [Candidatus Sulfotelmatobacter sp.]|nr:hypothetical protein [Candidatus Sulfotelmatobacter sp.]